MAAQVTLTLSDEVYEFALHLAEQTGRGLSQTLNDALENALGTWAADAELEVTQMADQEIIALADSRMDTKQGERMSKLLYKQQAGTITPVEKAELQLLMRMYEIGNLHKAQGIAEAVRRGLRKSPAS